MELEPLTVLNQRYTVKRSLGDAGPFSLTYIGQDVDSEDEYVIREFFPVHLVERPDGETSVEVTESEAADQFDSGLEYFRKESEVLADLRHEALPTSYDAFAANGTYYRVRPHRSGTSLARGLEEKGSLTEKAALSIMMPILGALQEAHENGLYHGGVSPRSIRLLEDGEVLLTNFRGAFFQLAREMGQMTDLVQPGTSAVEQYTPRGQQGPWTDVYSAAATICQIVTGQALPEATDRLEGDDPVENRVQDADSFSTPAVREALIDALTVDPSKRLQSISALIDVLTEASSRYDEGDTAFAILSDTSGSEGGVPETTDDEVEVISARAETEPPVSTADEGDDSGPFSRTALLVGVPILVLALGGGAWMMMNSGSTSAADGGSYQEYRSRADSLFEAGDYQTAEFLYNQALDLRDDDQYVQKRLDRLEVLQRGGGAQEYQERLTEGDRLRVRADSFYQAGAFSEAANQYSEALGRYYAAQDVNPDGAAVQERIQEIQKRQEQIAKQQAGGEGDSEDLSVDRLAEFFRTRGDQQLEGGNLQAALDKYQQALEYSPDSEELQTIVDDLEQEIEQQQRQETFQTRYNAGQEHLRAGEYEDAQTDFQRAAEIYPNNPDLQESLAEVNKQLKVEQRQTQQYEQYRAQGDSLLDVGNVDEAIASYEQALEIRPGDEYVQDRIEEAEQEREEIELAQQEIEEQEKVREKLTDEDGVFKTVDQPPQVKGGLATLTQDASYPEQARDLGLEGRVYVQAVVNPDGSVREAEVIRGLGEALDQEALRVVKNAAFTPGTYNGEPVPARKTVWIQFQIEE
jgi:TonB family protein